MTMQNISKEYLLDLAQQVVNYGMSKNIDDIEVFVQHYEQFQIMTEGRSIANERDKSEIGFAIRVLKNKSEGFSYSNKSNLEDLKTTVDDAIAISKVAPVNPGIRMPSPSEYKKIEGIYTESVNDLTADNLIEIAKDILEPMGEVKTDIRTSLSNVTKSEQWIAIANSLGVEAFHKSNNFNGEFFIVPREGDKVGSFVVDDFFTHDPKSIDYRKFGEELTQRAVRNMNAITPSSIDSDIVVFKEEAVFNPIGIVLVQAVAAHNVLLNRSMWKDKLNEKVAVDDFHVIDDAHNPTAGALVRAFDDEGTATQTTAILEDGILESFLFDELRASKMNAISTGNSWRGFIVSGARFINPPSTILPNAPTIKPGNYEFEELIEDIKLGITCEYFAGSSRAENGMFSGLAKGAQLIRNGELAEPLINVSIGGNVFDLLMNIQGITKDTKLSNQVLTTPKIRANGIKISTQK
jgi:PmbA protein